MRSPAILLMFVRCGLAAPLRGLSVQLQTVEKLQTHTHPELWSEEFWIKIGLSMLLVLAGGLFAGCVCPPSSSLISHTPTSLNFM